MTVPVNVYLDNSDLSILFKARDDRAKALRAELFDLKDAGRAIYSFSFWHIVEFIQKPAPGYEKEHRAKAVFLSELCDENALPHYLDLLDDAPPSTARAIWLPQRTIDQISIDLLSSFRGAVDRREGLNRQQRRTLKSNTISKRVLSNARNLERFSADLPITEKFKNEQSLTKFVRGEIDKKEFGRRLAELFCAPPIFYDEWYGDTKTAGILGDMSSSLGQRLFDTLTQATAALRKVTELRKEMLAIKKNYYDQKRRLDPQLGALVKFDEGVFRNIPKADPEEMLKDIIVDERLSYIRHYFAQAILHQQFKPNDIGDLLHLFYTQDVDLMRCDRTMYALMRNCPQLPTERFVSLLDNLPFRIRTEFEAR